MELAIPIIALGGLYYSSKQSSSTDKQNSKQGMITSTSEGFSSTLPNTNIPNKNYPSEYPIQNETLDKTSAHPSTCRSRRQRE